MWRIGSGLRASERVLAEVDKATRMREWAKVALSKSKEDVAGLVSERACKFLPSVLRGRRQIVVTPASLQFFFRAIDALTLV